jgi:hypothetical protein
MQVKFWSSHSDRTRVRIVVACTLVLLLVSFARFPSAARRAWAGNGALRGQYRGILVLFHGCSHSGNDWVRLPQDKRILGLAHTRKLFTLTPTALDPSGCWDGGSLVLNEDVGPVMASIRQARLRLGEDLPVYALGASSGGFVTRARAGGGSWHLTLVEQHVCVAHLFPRRIQRLVGDCVPGPRCDGVQGAGPHRVCAHDARRQVGHEGRGADQRAAPDGRGRAYSRFRGAPQARQRQVARGGAGRRDSSRQFEGDCGRHDSVQFPGQDRPTHAEPTGFLSLFAARGALASASALRGVEHGTSSSSPFAQSLLCAC